MNLSAYVGWALVFLLTLGAPEAEAGMSTAVAKEAAKRVTSSAVKQSVSAAATRRARARDAKAHLRAPAKPLPRSRTAYRYTTRERARWERTHGLASGRHMTAHGGPGRPLSTVRAQKRYGLPAKPQVRETIRLPKGQLVRHNKVQGGTPGQGELTSPKRVSPSAVQKVVPLR
jgi:hypothetical protein